MWQGVGADLAVNLGTALGGELLGGLFGGGGPSLSDQTGQQMNLFNYTRHYNLQDWREAQSRLERQQAVERAWQTGEAATARRFASREAKLARAFSHNAWLNQVQVDSEAIRRRVADAKAAGLHPLFALGTSANFSPAATVGVGGAPGVSGVGAGVAPRGQASTGSFYSDGAKRRMDFGAAAARALEATRAARYQRQQEKTQRRVANAQIDRLKAATARDHAEALAAASKWSRVAAAGRISPTDAEKKIKGWPQEKLPQEHSKAPTLTYRRKDGSMGELSTPKDMDEVRQAEYVYKEAVHHLSDLMLSARNRLKDVRHKSRIEAMKRRQRDRNRKYRMGAYK